MTLVISDHVTVSLFGSAESLSSQLCNCTGSQVPSIPNLPCNRKKGDSPKSHVGIGEEKIGNTLSPSYTIFGGIFGVQVLVESVEILHQNHLSGDGRRSYSASRIPIIRTRPPSMQITNLPRSVRHSGMPCLQIRFFYAEPDNEAQGNTTCA